MARRILAGVLVVASVAACNGLIGDVGGNGPGPARQTEIPEPGEFDLEASEVSRLTVRQLEAVVRDLLDGTELGAREVLPGDVSIFTEVFEVPDSSNALVEGLEGVLETAVAGALADPVRRAAIIGCAPTSETDAECARSFIVRFGRRALRRPLSDEEVAAYMALHAEYASHPRGGFDVGVDTVLRAMLMHPELLYHFEIGEPTEREGIVRLTSWEVASRLSFFIWGTAPDDWLLDLAAAGELVTEEQRRGVAAIMLDDARARVQVDHFHAAWLGYDSLPHDPMLVARMRTQTRASIERVVFDEQRPWLDLFRLDESFVDDTLAEHYGLPAPGSPTPVWIDVAGLDRGSLLAQGSVLSIEGKFEDTSPVQRGHMISSRLMCRTIPEPTGLMVNVDEPPPGDGCKPERYAMHSQGGCADCHVYLDPVGMGLEAYDNLGRFRTHEPDRPDCEITGEGRLPDVGTFNGPTELGEALIESEKLDECVVSQIYRFAVGRHDIGADGGELTRLTHRFREDTHRLDQLVVELAASPAFVHRRAPAE